MRKRRAAVDLSVAAIARAQHGVITTCQLAAVGLSKEAIAHRTAHGHLRRRHHGVYVVGPLEGPLSRTTAALLACGPGAVLGGTTAAALWGLVPADDRAVDVLSARRVSNREGIRPRRCLSLDAQDVRRLEGLPVTSAARTLLDLPPKALDRAIEEAHTLGLATPDDIADVLRRHQRRPGSGRLAAALNRAHEPRLTRSQAERRLLQLIRDAGLPTPATNVRFGRYEVDLLWRAQRLVVEVDGYAFHSSRAAFERDRRRDARLQAAGYRVVRVTWRRIAHDSLAVIADLAALLAAAAGPAAPP